MKLLLFVLLLIFLPIATAEKINGLEFDWGGWTSYPDLGYTNPSITKGDFVIKVIDFDWLGLATISVTYKGETQYGIFTKSDETIFDFTKKNGTFLGIKIRADDISKYDRNSTTRPVNIGTFPCCPKATISVAVSQEITQKKPKLELVLSTNWDGRLGYISAVEVKVRNTGDAAFSLGNVTINISGLKLASEKELSDQALTYNPSKETVTRGWSAPFLAGNSYSLNLSLKSVLLNKSTYKISVQSYFKDPDGKVYSDSKSETLTILDAVKLEKKITESTILGERTYGTIDKYFGLSNVTVVNIYIKNTQSYPLKSINLTDTIMKDFTIREGTISPGDGFILSDNGTKLQWVFDLNVSERREFRYEMTAQKTGSFPVPSAVATWNEWGSIRTASSDKPTTRVYGVFVVVSKRIDQTRLKLNERINVTLNLENIGDFPVGLNVTDILPKNTTFISGETTYSGFLYPKESVALRYNLSADYPGELGFPSPQLTFWKKDYEGAYGFIPANNITVFESSETLPDVTAINPAITPTPAQTPSPKSLIDIVGEKAPWLEGAIPIIMLFVAIILMLLLHVINRGP